MNDVVRFDGFGGDAICLNIIEYIVDFCEFCSLCDEEFFVIPIDRQRAIGEFGSDIVGELIDGKVGIVDGVLAIEQEGSPGFVERDGAEWRRDDGANGGIVYEFCAPTAIGRDESEFAILHATATRQIDVAVCDAIVLERLFDVGQDDIAFDGAILAQIDAFGIEIVVEDSAGFVAMESDEVADIGENGDGRCQGDEYRTIGEGWGNVAYICIEFDI